MAEPVDSLTTIRDNLLTELRNETARRAALTAAGNPPPTTYTVNGKSVDWNGYLQTVMDRLKEINELLAANDLYEERVRAYSG